jgi:hypothetical protein
LKNWLGLARQRPHALASAYRCPVRERMKALQSATVGETSRGSWLKTCIHLQNPAVLAGDLPVQPPRISRRFFLVQKASGLRLFVTNLTIFGTFLRCYA